MPTPARQAKEQKFSAVGRLLIAFIFLLSFTLSLYFFLHSTFFAVKNVEIQGNQTLHAAEITRLTGIVLGTNIFLLDEEGVATHLRLSPIIDEASIKRKLPSTVVVQVQERAPLALVPVQNGFIAIDRNAMHLTRVGSIVEINRPVLTGFNVPNDTFPGQMMDLPGTDKVLMLMENMSPDLIQAISEINLSTPDSMKIYSLDGVEIRVGKFDHFEENLALLEEILITELPKVKPTSIEYVDMSFVGSPVIKYISGKTR